MTYIDTTTYIYQQDQLTTINYWNKLWFRINASRLYNGRKGNLSSFVILDRHNH